MPREYLQNYHHRAQDTALKHRTRFIRLLIIIVALVAVAGLCNLALPRKIISPKPAITITGQEHEAPILTEMVQAGKLPPLNQRLPTTPMVVMPVESIGEYGGTWHMLIMPSADDPSFVRSVGYENLVRWTPDWQAWG